MKILAIGDSANNIFLLKKYCKNVDIHIIDFPRKGVTKFTTSKNDIEFFDSLLISKQVEKIRKIKNDYDLCIALPWAGARIAYLAGVNYVMYFVGSDIVVPPFKKKSKYEYLDYYEHNHNFFIRKFYKKIFERAITVISGAYFPILQEYRDDAIRLDRSFIDTDLFNENIKPIKMEHNKFKILSAQRFGLEKGFDIIWEALNHCKTDFDFLQVKWFIGHTTTEDFEDVDDENKKLLRKIPKQVKFIPLIKREELGQYFKASDLVMGQMRTGIQGAIEREAAYCKKPVICYTNPKEKVVINDEEIIPPFLPQSNDPIELAKIIDLVVESKEFRENLINKEFEYVKKLCDPESVSYEWEKIFNVSIKKPKASRKYTVYEKIQNYIILKFEKFYIKKLEETNFKVWGKEQYQKLTKT